MSGKCEALRSKLLGDIHSGVFPPHGKIPSRNRLSQRYGFSRSTVDRVVRQLIEEGRLAGDQGRGTFVLPPMETSLRKLYIISAQGPQDLQWTMLNRFFRDEDCPVPMTALLEDEVPLHLSSMTAPGVAVIWFCPSMYSLSYMRRLEQASCPQLLVNRDYLEYDSIATDQMETMREALTWLLIEGGREVAVVSYQPTPDKPYLYERTVAFFECACRLGGRFGSNAIHCREFRDLAPDMVETVQQLLCGPAPVKSIAILHHNLVFPFVTCAFSLGKAPGRDYRLMSFDYAEELRHYPGICMVRQRFDYMAQEAVRWLKARMEGRQESFHELIKGELVMTE